MKCVIFLLVFVCLHSTIAFSTYWKDRIEKYNELLKCEYYTTSESKYFRDYFEFENITQVHFYSLSQNQIKFRLIDDIHLEQNALQFVIGERFEQSTCCDINGSQKTEIFAKSYIQRPNNSELKTLITPEIIRTDQPNEISVTISEDGYMHVLINGKVELIANVPNEIDVNALKYISFAASRDMHIEEFFYNCDE